MYILHICLVSSSGFGDSRLPAVCSLAIPGDLPGLGVEEGDSRMEVERGREAPQPMSCILRRLKSRGAHPEGHSWLFQDCLKSSLSTVLP